MMREMSTPGPRSSDQGAIAGRWIVRCSLAITGVFLVSAVAALAVHALDGMALVVDLGAFAAGIGLFFWAYAIAVDRSRRELIGIGGLYLLAGSAPRRIQVLLLGSLTAQVAIALATAAARPYTAAAFGVLVPMSGLGCCGRWAAEHGTFPPRTVGPKDLKRRARPPMEQTTRHG